MRRGPDREPPFPLGIFYGDNASKKRWVLKLDDPKLLAQIDAVFVTIGPNGGSRKPKRQAHFSLLTCRSTQIILSHAVASPWLCRVPIN